MDIRTENVSNKCIRELTMLNGEPEERRRETSLTLNEYMVNAMHLDDHGWGPKGYVDENDSAGWQLDTDMLNKETPWLRLYEQDVEEFCEFVCVRDAKGFEVVFGISIGDVLGKWFRYRQVRDSDTARQIGRVEFMGVEVNR